MTRVPCPSQSADRYFADQEAANEEACYSAAAEYGVTPEQADHCDGGSIGCLSCPFRNPDDNPVMGDRLRLRDGQLIEVLAVFPGYEGGPRLEYERVNWKRIWGGRKSYVITMAAWKKKTDHWQHDLAQVMRRGPERIRPGHLKQIQANAAAAVSGQQEKER